MHLDIVGTVLAREWRELLRNRLLLASIVVVPMIVVVLPLALGALVQSEPLPPELVDALARARPEWASLTPQELSTAYGFQQFLMFFLMLPAFIPLSIATFSIIGEKQARSLEAVLATPIRTGELLAGKALAALTPGLVGGIAAYLVFAALTAVLYGPSLAAIVTDPSWLAAVFLLGPAVGFVSIVLGVIVSSRSNDPRTAQQIGSIIIIPLVAVTLLQATGIFFVGAAGYAIAAAITTAAGLVGLRIGVRLFGRESILTRWR